MALPPRRLAYPRGRGGSQRTPARFKRASTSAFASTASASTCASAYVSTSASTSAAQRQRGWRYEL